MPAEELHVVTKPFPFKGWAMDMIRKNDLVSSKRQNFIIVATNVFTKWVEAQSMVDVLQDEVIKFIQYQIMYSVTSPNLLGSCLSDYRIFE